MKKKLIILSVLILLITGIFLSYLSIHHFIFNTAYPNLIAKCHFSNIISCNYEARSLFSRIIYFPVSLLLSTIYLFCIYLSALNFFKSGTNKQLNSLFINYYIFFAVIISVIVQISFIIFNRIIGLYYPLLFLLNIILFIVITLSNKTIIKEKILNNKNYKVFSHETQLKKHFLHSLLIFILLFGLNNIYFFLMRYSLRNYLKPANSPNEINAEKIKKDFITEFTEAEPVVFSTADLPAIGNPGEGKIIIVEFTNSRCNFCLTLARTLEEYMIKYPDKIFIYTIPVISDSDTISGNNLSYDTRILYATYLAYKNGKYGEFYKSLYLKNDSLMQKNYETVFNEALKKADIDYKDLELSTKEKNAQKWVQYIAGLSDSYKIEGTPTLFIGGKKVSGGGLSPDVFKVLIEKIKKNQ